MEASFTSNPVTMKNTRSRWLLCLSLPLMGILLSASQPLDKSFDRDWAKVGEKLYAARHETSVLDYQEFLQAIRSDETLYQACLPDSQAWTAELAYGDPYVESYFQHPAFSSYPILGISYESAQAYCVWLTEAYQKLPDRKFERVRFRLPTEAEWEHAAVGGLENAMFPWELGNRRLLTSFCQDKKGRYRANFRVIDQTEPVAQRRQKPLTPQTP